MSFSNKVYDVLKWIAQYLLPAMATLYFALAKLWNFPYAEEVVGTISAIDVFIGALLGISSAGYSGDGTIKMGDDDSSEIELYNDVAGKKRIVLEIKGDE